MHIPNLVLNLERYSPLLCRKYVKKKVNHALSTRKSDDLAYLTGSHQPYLSLPKNFAKFLKFRYIESYGTCIKH